MIAGLVAAQALSFSLATTHVGDSDFDYNNHNPGVGIEWQRERFVYGLGYIQRNSYRARSGVLSVVYKQPTRYPWLAFGLGGALANGYKQVTESGFLISPVLSVDMGPFRIVTSYPTAMKALGRTWRGRKYSGTEVPVFVEAKNLNPFINNELSLVPTEFKTDKGVMCKFDNSTR